VKVSYCKTGVIFGILASEIGCTSWTDRQTLRTNKSNKETRKLIFLNEELTQTYYIKLVQCSLLSSFLQTCSWSLLIDSK
jgi:hypothetical protein